MLGLEVLEWLTILGVASIGMIVVILFIPTKKENAKELMNYQTKINDEVFKIVIEHLKFMSQYELSKALGISQPLISQISNDEHNIRESTYKKIIVGVDKLNEI